MTFDVIISGAGIVGLATALKILEKRPDTKLLILEKENRVAAHQTGHNSGVIHSGIYYKPGSLKAKYCIQGYKYLVDFCNKHSVPFKICGKVIVATNEYELIALKNIYERGIENGLSGLKRIGKDELKEIEPHANGIKAVYVPQTGIVDFKVVADKYAEVVLSRGGEIKFNCKVTDVRLSSYKVEVVTGETTFTSKTFINCSGLYSDKVARLTNRKINVKIIPFRGEYYKIKPEREKLVKNLIYPVPNPAFPFLGVHFTRMMKGGVEAGPNAVFAFKREGYKKSNIKFSELFESLMWRGFRKVASKYYKTGIGEYYRSFSKIAFTRALQKLVPEIQKSDLVEGGSGVRAQAIDNQGNLIDDFLIDESSRVINVLNAPSPAATASLSIGETISNLLIHKLNLKK